jgi:DNA topoisomerase VI subunit B
MTGHLPARGSAGKSAPSLSRHVFKTSRLAEFCSRKELVNQTGHAAEDWPLVILKELVDNALDGAEEAGTAPIIESRFRKTRSP